MGTSSGQVDAAVLSVDAGQRGATPVPCSGLHSRRLSADPAPAEEERAMVIDDASRESREERREGHRLRPLHGVPDGRGGSAPGGVSANLLYGFERFILQSHRQRAFTALSIVGTRASADRRDGDVVEGSSPSAFVSFRPDNYEVTNSGRVTVHTWPRLTLLVNARQSISKAMGGRVTRGMASVSLIFKCRIQGRSSVCF